MIADISKQALMPLIKRLDRSEEALNARPSFYEETTRFPKIPWDLRTIIMVFPPDAPFQYLNLNVLLGLTGVPFDRKDLWQGKDPKDAFDLQFALEGKDKFVTYKNYHSIQKELSYRQDEVYFKLGERLLFKGKWPDYRIEYTQPEVDLEISMDLTSWPEFHWWAYFSGLYWHYTSFYDCHLEWKWDNDKGSMDVVGLHDHGWGRNILPIRVPLKVFRYEVMRLSGDTFGVSLWTEGPFGLKLKSVGLVRRDHQPIIFMKQYDCQVLEWGNFTNYAGLPCRVPMRWIGKQTGDQGSFTYEAKRTSEPRAILGEGFLYAFDFHGDLSGFGENSGKIEGEGYVEQVGSFF